MNDTEDISPAGPSGAQAKERESGSETSMDGFYARSFDAGERLALLNQKALSLLDEIDLLRVTIRRVVELSSGRTHKEAIETARAVGMAAIRLSRLMREQTELQGKDGDRVNDAIIQALTEVLRDLGLK